MTDYNTTSDGGKILDFRRNFADILIAVTSSKVNDTALTSSNVAYGGDYDSSFPLVTLYYYYEDEEDWYGYDRVNSYNNIYPYATVDGSDAKVASGQYPSVD